MIHYLASEAGKNNTFKTYQTVTEESNESMDPVTFFSHVSLGSIHPNPKPVYLLQVNLPVICLWCNITSVTRVSNTRRNSVIQYLKEVVALEAGKNMERIQNRVNL